MIMKLMFKEISMMEMLKRNLMQISRFQSSSAAGTASMSSRLPTLQLSSIEPGYLILSNFSWFWSYLM